MMLSCSHSRCTLTMPLGVVHRMTMTGSILVSTSHDHSVHRIKSVYRVLFLSDNESFDESCKFFLPHVYLAPPFGVRHWNFIKIFGVRKLAG